MPQTSASRTSWYHRPAILTLAGAAAAYSAYKLFIAYSRLPSSTLGRRNATHRSHRMSSSSMSGASSQSSEQVPPPGSETQVTPGSENHQVDGPAETEADMEHPSSPNHVLQQLLYYIAEENATRKAYIHRGIRCEGCQQFPILGTRYHCLNCPDFDLCVECEAHNIHPKNHIFAKIKIPLSLLSQPPKSLKLWYAGNPQKLYPLLDRAIKKEFAQKSGFDEPELDALYDQFTCIANVPWPEDPNTIGVAIDRRAFNRTMCSDRWENRFAPNVLLDRMFAFYDLDGNSLIDFGEFVIGMAYLRGSSRFASLERALQAFDIDGDGYVDRSDFLRVLRGKFEIQQQLIIDATEGFGVERTQGSMGVLRSSQPISSVFNQEQIPLGEDRTPQGKRDDLLGELDPVNEAETTILEDDSPFPGLKGPPDELKAAFDRFEDMLHSVGQTDGVDPADEAALVDILRGQELVDLSQTPEEEPYVKELLWHKKEDGLISLLDRLFTDRDFRERQARQSRNERRQWRKAIDEFTVNYQRVSGSQSSHSFAEERRDMVARGIVPTDHESLEQWEVALMSAPLETLLEVSGYGIRDDAELDTATFHSNNSAQAGTLAAHNESRHTRKVAPSPLREISSIDDEDEDEQKPSVKKLHYWAQLDIIDRQIEERGGEGRMSLAEVERTVVDQGLDDINGLIRSWLEWAAF